MKYNVLLIDIDDTILNFKAAEKFAFDKTHKDNNLTYSENDYLYYRAFNISLWQKFEKGEITIDDIQKDRFRLYFKEKHIDFDAAKFQEQYENNLALNATLFEDKIIETIEYISNKAKIFAVTNGMMHIQKNRLKLCGIDKYLSGNFVSQAIGFRKPDSKFFEYVENNIPNFDKEKTLLVGDSLSADIAAAKYGYHTCYINRQNIAIPDDKIKPEFEINYFYELKKFFED